MITKTDAAPAMAKNRLRFRDENIDLRTKVRSQSDASICYPFPDHCWPDYPPSQKIPAFLVLANLKSFTERAWQVIRRDRPADRVAGEVT